MKYLKCSWRPARIAMPCTERCRLATLAAAALGLAGCAASPVNLARDGAVRVEMVSSPAALVWYAEPRAGGGNAWASGEVIRRKEWPADRPGHVDLVVFGPDGIPLAQTGAALQPVRTAGGDTRRLAFTVPLNRRPPPGSTVRVVHHAAARSGGAADALTHGAHRFSTDTTDEE